MSTMPDVERVTPPVSPAPGGASPTSGRRVKLDKKTMMYAGAGVVAIAALISARSSSGGAAVDTSGVPTLDTTETDLYSALQPEIEGIRDEIEQLGMRDSPTPAVAAPATPGAPTPPPPAVKPKKKPGRPKPGPRKPKPAPAKKGRGKRPAKKAAAKKPAAKKAAPIRRRPVVKAAPAPAKPKAKLPIPRRRK